MTVWHALQLGLALLALLAIARAARELCVRAPSDEIALCEAIETALQGGQTALAAALARECAPAWAARVLTAGLEAADESGEPAAGQRAMEEEASNLAALATDRIKAFLALGRIASPLSFLAIALALAGAFGGGHGLLALQRGLVESIAIAHALLSFGIGVGTAGACMGSAALLRTRLQRERASLGRVIARATRALQNRPHM